ncbi:MAG: glucosamine-6-phosphate deaminase [Alicyclobacillus sp.]|nr:glucosamine-6-phosphate deaminase [Alicyclobacillus sp.]
MKIRVFDSARSAGLYAASLMEAVILREDNPVLGLATGGTVLPCYQAFRGLVWCGLDLSRTTTINLDEYIGLDAQHPQSYHYFMEHNLFAGLPSRPRAVHIPDGTAGDLERECARYDDLIHRNPIDFQLLGIGTNGHIGFNEPSHSLLSRTHVVSLTEETIASNARFFERVEDVPRRALTMGVQSILQARQIVLMAFGRAKADVVARAVQGEVRTDLPATMLQLHRDVTFILDVDSASALPREVWGGHAVLSDASDGPEPGPLLSRS